MHVREWSARPRQPHTLPPDVSPEPQVGPIDRRDRARVGRIGCIGFGGPPAHVTLLRELCVTRREWLTDNQFERALAAVNLLPGPASTQLAIYCAWRLRGPRGALVGGLCFTLPGLVLILALSTLFLAGSPPRWVRGAGMGAGAAVAAVAVRAGIGVAGPIYARVRGQVRARVTVYALAGAVAAATVGPRLVLVLLGCGAIELAWRGASERGLGVYAWPALAVRTLTSSRTPGAHVAGSSPVSGLFASFLGRATLLAADPGGTGALAWTALKVGALAFGGGFVIVPLMQADAVNTYHWMTHAQFLNAVALGQVTPGPVTQTVAAVGYAAGGLAGGLFAALVAFAPSFSFILIGAARFERLLANERVLVFLAGAAPAAAGAIIGSAVPLTAAIGETWQYAVLAGAVIALLVLRRGVVLTLLGAAIAGALAVLLGAPA
jgi:chromate transporter